MKKFLLSLSAAVIMSAGITHSASASGSCANTFFVFGNVSDCGWISGGIPTCKWISGDVFNCEKILNEVLKKCQSHCLPDSFKCAPKTEAPETEAPETETPETEAPETEAPETEAPETETPETEAPETETPETEAPETEAPETEAPETEAPETETPETEESDIAQDSVHEYVLRIVELVNDERTAAGLNEVSLDLSACAAAQVRAAETVSLFSHTRPDGSSCFTALTEQGVSYRTAGENIAFGQKSPEEVMEAWMNSSGHRANILGESFTHIGVGYTEVNGVKYWTQMFLSY